MTSTLDVTASDADLQAGELLRSGRAVLESMLLVEYRLACVASLVERFGSRHAERAAAELQAAVEGLSRSERTRGRAAAGLTETLALPPASTFTTLIDAAPAGERDALRQLQASMRSAKHRITKLMTRAEDVLGRRLTLVAEVLAFGAEPDSATYGRELRPRPRFVDGLL